MTDDSVQVSDSPTNWLAADGIGKYITLGIFCSILAAIICISALSMASTKTQFEQRTESWWFIIVSFGVIWTTFIYTLMLVSKRFGSGSFREDFRFFFKPGDLVVGFVAGLACQAVSVLLLLPLLLNDKLHDALTEQSDNLVSKGHLTEIVTGVAVIVCAPIVEELFFRGFVYRWFRQRRKPVAAVLISAVVFGFSHVLGQPLGVIALTGVGAVLAVTSRLKDRLGPSIVAHGTFNAISFALILADRYR